MKGDSAQAPPVAASAVPLKWAYECAIDGCPCNSQVDRVETHLRTMRRRERIAQYLTSGELVEALLGYVKFQMELMGSSRQSAWNSAAELFKAARSMDKVVRRAAAVVQEGGADGGQGAADASADAEAEAQG